MSAPHTDVEKQSRRHSVPLIGMAAAVGFALILLIALYVWLSADEVGPTGAEVETIPGVGTVAGPGAEGDSVATDPAGNTTGDGEGTGQ